MAGMFYSLKEAAQQLGKTEDEVRQLAEEGKLRTFRDGSNLLFKVEEVNALLAEGAGVEMGDTGAVELPEAGAAEQPGEVPDLDTSDFDLEALAGEVEPGEVPGDEAAPAPEGSAQEDIFAPEEETGSLEPVGEADASSELGLAPEPQEADTSGGTTGEDLALLEEEQPAAEPAAEGTGEEISLAPESGVLASESDITDMDTALTGEGVSVLGEGDSEYDVTDDSTGETVGPAGTATEASLEEIEEDVNLDSFGSGSGLLDLSLQADDTSLGGILDEIYTAEAGEEERAPAEGEGAIASFDEITAEAEHAPPEEEAAVVEPVAVMPAALTTAYVEAAPDTQSNVLGALLFVPLVALLYTAIVAVAGMRNVVPRILEAVQGFVWYIMGGAIVVSLIVVGASFVMGGERTPKTAKLKEKKPEKAGKEKKEKPARAEKPTREKKSFFGKKK